MTTEFYVGDQWKDEGFGTYLVRIDNCDDYGINFSCWEISGLNHGPDGDKDIPTFGNSEDGFPENPTDVGPDLTAWIKWDGCAHYRFAEEENGYLHVCGNGNAQDLALLITTLFDEASRRVKQWDGTVPASGSPPPTAVTIAEIPTTTAKATVTEVNDDESAAFQVGQEVELVALDHARIDPPPFELMPQTKWGPIDKDRFVAEMTADGRDPVAELLSNDEPTEE